MQERLLVVGEHALAGGTHERREPEEVIDQLRARQRRPHALERFPHIGPRAQTRAQLLVPTRRWVLPARERACDRDVERAVAVEHAPDVARLGQRRTALVAPLAIRADGGGLVPRDEQVEDAPYRIRTLLVVGTSPAARCLDG